MNVLTQFYCLPFLECLYIQICMILFMNVEAAGTPMASKLSFQFSYSRFYSFFSFIGLRY